MYVQKMYTTAQSGTRHRENNPAPVPKTRFAAGFCVSEAMKHGNPHHRPGKASSRSDEDDDQASEHYSFSAGEDQGRQNGGFYTELREINRARTANARMSRPHKTG